MDDLDDDDIDDETAEIAVPPVEVRVPPEWQSKMSARSLGSAEPLALAALLEACAGAIEARAISDAQNAADEAAASDDAASPPPPAALTFAQSVYEHVSAQHNGNHKTTEAAVAGLVNGVEASWAEHACVQLFGELCGMLSAPMNEVVNRRVLALLAAHARRGRGTNGSCTKRG